MQKQTQKPGFEFKATFNSGVTMTFFCPKGQDKMFVFKKECERLGILPFAVLH